ncbi:hypothetical protein C8Q76DRAFT_798385 [Earliella scabrosa]|nr:hypothetical protein C8Q76DRAFT_798385 [Earliella scabrosa]
MLSKVAVEKALLAFAMLVLILNAAFTLTAHQTMVRAHKRDAETPLWRVERKEVALEIDSWTHYHLSCYSWFGTYNYLIEVLPPPTNLGEKLLRQAFIGFCASVVSDTKASSGRDGIKGFSGRGLKTRMLAPK